jgi:LysR family transcriptional regulator for bpeEF and oprC
MDRLQAMRVFVSVAELSSFTRAASALQLSRARVSEAVAELERVLGARLVHRTTRRVSLSDDGRAYYERARQILADVGEAEAVLVGSRSSARGRLRVAMPMALARLYVVPALPGLFAAHPELALEVRLENRTFDLLEEGVDCALSYGKPTDEELVARSISQTHLLTCAAPAYLARRGVPLVPDDLGRHQCVTFLSLAGARPTQWLFESDGQALTHQPTSHLGFNSMEACVDAAAAGLGVTQVLSSLAERAIRSRKLRPVLGKHAAGGPDIYLVYPQHRQLSARLRVLLDFLAELFQKREMTRRRGEPRVTSRARPK